MKITPGAVALLIIVLSFLGLLPALLARGKGLSFIKWWIYGALAFPLALPHVLLLGVVEPSKRCSFCGKNTKMSAAHCPACGYEFM